jgi:signal peptidase II
MQKASEKSRWMRNLLFFLIAALVIASDQLSKIWIRANIPVGQSLFEAGFFKIINIRNSGAAFGLFQGFSSLFTAIAVVALVAFLVYVFVIYRKYPSFDTMPNRVAIRLMFGGTAGNLIDRLRFGFVTDFIDLTFWPAFNIADSAVTVGAILFAYSVLFISRR